MSLQTKLNAWTQDHRKSAQMLKIHARIQSVLQQPPRPDIKHSHPKRFSKHRATPTCRRSEVLTVPINGIAKFPVHARPELLEARQRVDPYDSSVVGILVTPEIGSAWRDIRTTSSVSARKGIQAAVQQSSSLFGSVALGDVDLNLWKAKPPRYCQYLDMESEHMPGDTSSGTTGTDDTSVTLVFHHLTSA